ncbi:rho guanine nucleotide exchange factor 18 isoform X1 [Oncorhynchus mykiss]|uniref:rho guanine nucleotide exchange factor 18 isoform X1 n=2 Tax=Oncorhynchus mykiss TaxID=8022 RepID=UPI00187865C0|nr:rho guanine nucleotide exchange factor 18 isoform X1 [Oncorhynchus mykiss]XP_021444412.2 rho guanine nucleotide exchange factor 18 isoform X1 [Oncorhynchus mykiss]
MDNLDAVRGLSPRSPPPEDSVSLSSSSTDIINLEDGHYSALLAELEADAQDLEGESWSVSVDQQYIKRLHKDAIKRQDVIYELIQTELYHMRTLKLLLSVYQYELRRNLQMEETRLDRMFPQMDSLLHIHQHFLWCLRDCRDGQNHYTVTQLGAILINQFSGEMGERMKESYGDCCSHHTDAVSFYKEQLQNNKKFQNLITKIGRLSIVRQLGVPECILLVTQRLAKYPFLVERILQNTDADSEEHDALAQALVLIRETISAVDSQVHDYERASWLRDIGRSLEPHSRGRLKDGRVLKREDLAVGSRNLLHEGTVNWQAANRWLKGSLCMKDAQIMQSLTEKLRMFADMAEAVTGLEDVANHSRLLLRSDDLDPQQGETLLKGAITEVENLQRLLLSGVTLRDPYPPPEDFLGSLGYSLRPEDLRLLRGGLGLEGLRNLAALRTAETLGRYVCNPIPPMKNGNIQAGERPGSVAVQPLDSSQHSNSDPQLQDLDQSESLEMSAESPAPASYWTSPCPNPSFPEAEFFDRVLLLSQKLYSLLAIVSQQDSHIELQRASLSDREHPGRPRGNVLLEQEKQRNMEKQREEMANFHKLQTQHRQEQARWEEEQACHQLQAEVLEAELRHREEECRRLKEKLAEERGELERWRETYQQDLERLRESTRTVEKQKERLDLQMKLKKNKTIAKPGSFNFNTQQAVPHSQSFRGDLPHSASFRGDLSQSFRGDLIGGWTTGGDVTPIPASKVHIQPSLSLATAFLEPPPEVPLHRESISPAPPKAEVPIHLISTTNQVVHKPGAVQQQIPTKLATLSSKGKEKSRKKGSHQRMHSAASIDMSQVVPIRVTRKEGGSLRGKRTVSPHRSYQTDRFFSPPEPLSNAKHSQTLLSSSSMRMNSQSHFPPPEPPHPPPFPKDIASKPTKERVIYL